MDSQTPTSKAGELPSFRRLAIVALAAAVSLTGCSDPTTPPAEEPAEAAERRRAVLASLADNVILPAHADFVTQSETLAGFTESGDTAGARSFWPQATTSWHHVELLQVGPAGAKDLEVAGAQDLRFEIYSWPQVNRCRVDQELVEQAYSDRAMFASEPINVRGLDALEYLLFRMDTANDCAPNSAINREGTWAQLDEADIQARRQAYAHTAALLVAEQALGLRDAWTGGFRDQFADAGASSTVYPTTQAALNEYTNALFYLDKETKDMKLAVPLGLSDCDTDACPEALESPWSRQSGAQIAANVRGFRTAFLGGDGLGLDDLLIDAGADALAAEMIEKMDRAVEVCDAMGTLEDELTESPANKTSARACYDAIKGVMDLYKTQFHSVLDLEPPDRAEGDND